ncbi:MAG: cbb3-type cytochrome c oxidase subunit II [Chthoniobacterales bacterium]
MKGVLPLFLGIFGTFAFSWLGLTMVPNAQIGHLNPQSDEEGTDIYPMPRSGMAERGRKVYIANGCVYCHSQQVRPDYGGSDINRKWGERRSAPRDYLFDRPALLGKVRMGPDLANMGKRAPAEEPAASPSPAAGTSPAASPSAPAPAAAAPSPAVAPAPAASASPAAATTAQTSGGSAAPTVTSVDGVPVLYSAAWHHRHLYAPRSISLESTMPAYRFLYEKRQISGEPAADALPLTGPIAPPEGWEIIPTYDAKCLVAYLMSLDQSHPLTEVKSGAPAAAPAPAKAAK